MISFRSLFKRVARYSRGDCLSPIKTNKEPDFDALLRTFYLLGLDCSLIVSKSVRKHELEQIKTMRKNWQQDDLLKNLFRAGAQPKVRAEWLDRELPRLQQDLAKFQVAENYRALEMEASQITKKIRLIEKDQGIISFQLESIEKTLAEHPDISRQDLLDLYAGLQQIFKPETLAHFAAVEDFHHSLSINRCTRLEHDKFNLQAQWRVLEQERLQQAELRDKKLQSLQGKKALDEYAALARQVAELTEERERLAEFLSFSSKLQENAQTIRERQVEEDRLAAVYADSKPLTLFDRQFSMLAEIMYPRTPAGIALELNTADNRLRYNLTVQIEGDNSDGINAAKILCFDWLVLMYGAHHSLDMFWHDNRLFADIDPGVRGRWFSFVNDALKHSGKQYIATLNIENYDAMKVDMDADTKKAIEDTVVLKLLGDNEKNKLLGIQFGKSSG